MDARVLRAVDQMDRAREVLLYVARNAEDRGEAWILSEVAEGLERLRRMLAELVGERPN